MSRALVIGALALFVIAGCVGCKPGEGSGPVKVWADPALKTVLEKLAPQFKHHHPAGWEIEYKESAELEKLSEASHPDVLLAIEPVVQKLTPGGVLDESTARTFAGDRLTIVCSQALQIPIGKVGDLPMTEFKAFGVASEGTSEGYYANEALISDGAMTKIKDLTKTFDSLDTLLAALNDGSLDLAMVFASTAAQQPTLHVSTIVPEDLHEDIRYSAVATKEAAKRHGVMELLKLLSEDADAAKLLGSYGYVDRKTAMEETK